MEYPSQKIARNNESDPHLFSCTFAKGAYNSISIVKCTSFIIIVLFLVYKSNFVHGIDFTADTVASCRKFEGILLFIS